MINGKSIQVVLPAYNAEKTLEATVRELPECVDDCLLVDDKSSDRTVAVAKQLGIKVAVHQRNRGYGGNQKTCYSLALANGADVVVMLHPDYQYTPRLVAALAGMVAYDVYDLALGSRILGGEALIGGMPFYKYISNRALTHFQPGTDAFPEFPARRASFRVPYRFPCLQPAPARGASARTQFRRFRL